MQRSFFVALLLCMLAVGVQAATSLCEYQSPLTNLSNLTLNFAYQFHNDPYGLETNDVSQGQFGVNYVRLYDSPEYGFDVALQNDMMISAEDLSTYTITADMNYKRYFAAERDVFAFAGSSVRSSSSFLKLGLSFSLGVGSGRFTDVTPLAKATRIVDFLVERGSLSDYLHPVDLKILALEIGSEAVYDSLVELLEVVQEVIENSGLVTRTGASTRWISRRSRDTSRKKDSQGTVVGI